MTIKELKTIIRAAQAGGKELSRYFGKTLTPHVKSTPADLTTEADLASEKAILKILRREFPDYNIYSEEVGKINNRSGYTFVIDPLDGTNNFVLGIPNFTVSIGLTKGKELVAGIIHAPLVKRTYWASVGAGAYLNGKKITVGSEDDFKRATISCVCSYTPSLKETIGLDNNLKKRGIKRVLRNWSVAYDFCLLAQGKIEAVISTGAQLYDFAAGKIIAREAGAIITDLRGRPEKDDANEKLVASNSARLHREIITILQD